jgi:drug/metabolite transporter (DMT)-like permease
VYVVWGSTYIGIRVTVETMPPLLSGGVRFFLAGVLTLGYLLLRRRGTLALPPRREIAAAAAVGVLLIFGGAGMVTLAETHVPAAIAAVLASTTSIWIVLYRLGDGDRLPLLTALGVAVGFIGVAVVLLPGAEATGVSIGWCFLVIVSSWCWSSGSYYGRRLPLPADPFVVAVIEMMAGGLAMVVVGLARGELADLDVDAISTRSLVAMAYLITAGAIAFSAYVWLLQHVAISTVVTHQYVNPVVAVVLAWLVLDESLALSALVGAALIVVSVAAIVRQESRPQPDPPDG